MILIRKSPMLHGIKNIEAQNKACISKLIWAVALKIESLQIKWVHERYIKGQAWWDYHPYHDTCWYWKKLCRVKEEVKWGSKANQRWIWGQTKDACYTVRSGYQWNLNSKEQSRWSKVLWSRMNIRRHTFPLRLMLKGKLPVKSRLAAYTNLSVTCQQCMIETETQEHIFYGCGTTKEVWEGVAKWTGAQLKPTWTKWLTWLIHMKSKQGLKQIMYAVVDIVV